MWFCSIPEGSRNRPCAILGSGVQYKWSMISSTDVVTIAGRLAATTVKKTICFGNSTWKKWCGVSWHLDWWKA